MGSSRQHPQGWISVLVPSGALERARGIRAERDRQYGNIFTEMDSDERWVGDLGELVFYQWLKHEQVREFEWIEHDAAGKPDFIIGRHTRVGVKTVKRKGAVRDGYTAQITARHADEPIEQFFFMSYEFPASTMWLLGGIDRQRFLKTARYYRASEYVHENYQVREGHEIYNIDIAELVPPRTWLDSLL